MQECHYVCIGQIFSCVYAGRAQMVKEQSRLEKLLLQQQREIRTLQRTYEITKAGTPSRHPANVMATCLAVHTCISYDPVSGQHLPA